MGYKKQQAARELGVDNKTIAKYWHMTEQEFSKYLLESKARSRCMEPYRAIVLDKVTQHRAITSAIIYDQLREFHPDFKPSCRSVRRFVADLREQEGRLPPTKFANMQRYMNRHLAFKHRWTWVQKQQKIIMKIY